MKKRFKRARKVEAIDLDITSLLDILVILLVFLLKNYNASELTVDIVKDVKVAESDSRLLGHDAPVVQISKVGDIFINNKAIGNYHQNGTGQLQEVLKQIKDRKPASDKPERNAKMINLIFDKDAEYTMVDAIMLASANEGFNQFKFIVKGNY